VPEQPRSGKNSKARLTNLDEPNRDFLQGTANRIRSMQQQLDMRPPASQVASPQEQFNRDVVASLKDLLAVVDSLLPQDMRD
jgi:hypothetical protein